MKLKLLLIISCILIAFFSCDNSFLISNKEIEKVKVFSYENHLGSFQYTLYNDASFTQEFLTHTISKIDGVSSTSYQIYKGNYSEADQLYTFNVSSLDYHSFQLFSNDSKPILNQGFFDLKNTYQETFNEDSPYQKNNDLALEQRYKTIQKSKSYHEHLTLNSD
ncbi:hypothetical protein [Flammeovirga pacifica]|uniref:Uncharacterized protein n=1 Tax=Flammeovirga pacifica TaxID=915059 RepID=A0A1S1YSD0_FLAPC|nr:hypothetical protein [Flammeovirga pacifica]OHX63937.1 hypothetical protein NH26_20215 [Flammeovirga pacifica]